MSRDTSRNDTMGNKFYWQQSRWNFPGLKKLTAKGSWRNDSGQAKEEDSKEITRLGWARAMTDDTENSWHDDHKAIKLRCNRHELNKNRKYSLFFIYLFIFIIIIFF